LFLGDSSISNVRVLSIVWVVYEQFSEYVLLGVRVFVMAVEFLVGGIEGDVVQREDEFFANGRVSGGVGGVGGELMFGLGV
ncbi:hypothetical protein, partial [Pseudomonas syringae group genomosp. 7]|uniref:hypothetical protein n=1 Tax=Pseudomonas syringae group genomosp. 7 TaxID=251699 RepID=UPI00376FF83D